MTDYRDYDLNEDMENKRDINEEATPASSTLTEQEVPVQPKPAYAETAQSEPVVSSVSSAPVYGHPAPEKKQPKKRRGMPFAAVISLVLVCALLFSGVGTAAGFWIASGMIPQNNSSSSSSSGTTSGTNASTTVAPTPVVDGDALTSNEIYQLACDQVVGIQVPITTTNIFGQTSSSAVVGSGFIISSDGYILTNYHVISYADQYNYDINVMLHDGTTYKATLVGGEADNDVAVIKIEANGLNAATIGDSSSMQVGQTVYAVGNPLGELNYSMTSGIVSALDRVISTDSSTSINMFQIDAAINSGNSGGPVYDAAGRVLGIVTAKYSESGVEGLGFAIPINDAMEIANQLIDQGYVSGKAYLGVGVQDIDNRYAQYYNIPMGAYVASVEDGSCAAKAGLSEGDVITAVNDTEVTSTSDLKAALKEFNAGDTVELTVYRSGSSSKVSVTLDEYVPENDSSNTQQSSNNG